MEWEPVIGLEVHTQLLTRSKAFPAMFTEHGTGPDTVVHDGQRAVPWLRSYGKEETCQLPRC